MPLACFLTGAAMAEDPGREPDAPERQLSRTELLLHRANSLESELERLHHLKLREGLTYVCARLGACMRVMLFA